MPKLKILSGKEVVKIFLCFGFVKAAQKGSHIKLARFFSNDTKQTLTIPNHLELDKGTIKAIYHVSESVYPSPFFRREKGEGFILKRKWAVWLNPSPFCLKKVRGKLIIPLPRLASAIFSEKKLHIWSPSSEIYFRERIKNSFL
ncbi:type II toxin-antitoxin system HicA family toxin [Patescibacteria group bacterium]|nr:type II toxin-antitoxin system HicA family toxin [Patescibacteria group bacterium]